LVLGGHDHVIMEEFVNGVPVIKNGSNFNELGLIHLYLPSQDKPYKGRKVNFEFKTIKVPMFE
jgi:hypothetical protein